MPESRTFGGHSVAGVIVTQWKSSLTLVAAVVSVLVGTGFNSAAFAADSHGCPADRICVWKDASYNGPRVVFAPGTDDPDFATQAPTNFSDGTPLNDNISSIDNNTGVTVQFYTDASFQGVDAPFGSHVAHATLYWNDAFSSYFGGTP